MWNRTSARQREQGVQESQNICESENNKDNKTTIKEIWVQKGNPNREVRAGVYCILVQSYLLGFGVQCLELHISSFG